MLNPPRYLISWKPKTQVQLLPAEIENKFSRVWEKWEAYFTCWGKWLTSASQQTSFPMGPLGAREGGGDRSRKCKSKTANQRLAFSEDPHVNCSLQRQGLLEIKASFSKLNSMMTGTSWNKHLLMSSQQYHCILGSAFWLIAKQLLMLFYIHIQWNKIAK